jgi:hypothetical protein
MNSVALFWAVQLVCFLIMCYWAFCYFRLRKAIIQHAGLDKGSSDAVVRCCLLYLRDAGKNRNDLANIKRMLDSWSTRFGICTLSFDPPQDTLNTIIRVVDQERKQHREDVQQIGEYLGMNEGRKQPLAYSGQVTWILRKLKNSNEQKRRQEAFAEIVRDFVEALDSI